MPDRKPKPATGPAPKTCHTCGRTITWRKKWERDWDHVRFCSDACRTNKPAAQDHQLEQTILDLLHQRGPGKTICPSEAARALASAKTPNHAEPPRELWQPLMEPARAAARRLLAQGAIDITQHGHTVDPSTAKGPIRLRLR
jgi:hypothetical protein